MALGDKSGAPSSDRAGDEGPGKSPTPLAGGWLQCMSLRSRANEPESKAKGRNNPQRDSQQQPAPAEGQASQPRAGRVLGVSPSTGVQGQRVPTELPRCCPPFPGTCSIGWHRTGVSQAGTDETHRPDLPIELRLCGPGWESFEISLAEAT